MSPNETKGNDLPRWDKILQALDDKLQLGLLEHLRRAVSYHFESQVLYIEAADNKDYEYLSRESVKQQLKIISEDSANVDEIIIRKAP